MKSAGYETIEGDNGQPLYLIGDEYFSEADARSYAQAEADSLAAFGDPDAYDGYPAAIAPVRPVAGA